MKLLLATKNQGKVTELKEMLKDLNIEVIDLSSIHKDIEVIEDGKTFEENALKKAYECHKATGLPCIADDSGLEVAYLRGLPGVHTARFAGERATDDENITKLLYEMRDAVDLERKARFVCTIALILTDGTIIITKGTCEGLITTEKQGDKGFGYDPVFYVPEYDMTFAELEEGIKNKISHRARALKKMKEYITRLGVLA